MAPKLTFRTRLADAMGVDFHNVQAKREWRSRVGEYFETHGVMIDRKFAEYR
jgi:hypothetical protein